MSLSDPVSDMLTRIRNANMAGLDVAEIPYSKMKDGILRIFKKEGFIRDFTAEGGGARKSLRVYLKYSSDREREPAIRGLKRVSRPGCRTYSKAVDMPRVMNGTGVAVVSTSQGLMSDYEAKTANLGGEVLCFVW